MEISINNNYSSYYKQNINNYGSNINKIRFSNIKTSDKTTAEGEYFKNLCDKYSNINLNMSNSYFSKENGITFNVSPEFVNKAISDPEAAKTLNRILDKAPLVTQYINDNHYALDGREVKSVNFTVDKNGGVSCKCGFVEENSKDANETASKNKDSDVNLNTIDRFSKDSKIDVAVSIEYLAKASLYPEVAKKLNSLLDSLENQMSSLAEYTNNLSDILTGKEAKSTKVIIDKNGECSCNVEFEQENSENTSIINVDKKSFKEQIKERNEKTKALKEVQEKAATEQKLSHYYNI